MRENLAVAIWLAFLTIATSLMGVGLIAYTVRVHADADGFVTWHKVFDQATPTSLPPSPSRPVLHITDDDGGSVAEYYKKYQDLSFAGAEIHFHGMCASACTFVLFTEFTGIRACADPGAEFGFHKPFAMMADGKTVLRTKAAVKAAREIWAMQLASLPAGLRTYLSGVRVPSATDGDETNTLLILPADLLLPKCPTTVAAQ